MQSFSLAENMCLDIAHLTPWNSETCPGSFNSAEINRTGVHVLVPPFKLRQCSQAAFSFDGLQAFTVVVMNFECIIICSISVRKLIETVDCAAKYMDVMLYPAAIHLSMLSGLHVAASHFLQEFMYEEEDLPCLKLIKCPLLSE